ncbi:MAG: amidohydrolase family protein, partial [Pseudomonadota bacterium]
MLDHVASGRLTLERLIEMTSTSVQRVFGLVGKGRIAFGYDADFTIVDRSGSFTITEDWVASRCGWSPFTGMELKGRVVGTIVRGYVAMWEAELGDTAQGEALRFASAL